MDVTTSPSESTGFAEKSNGGEGATGKVGSNGAMEAESAATTTKPESVAMAMAAQDATFLSDITDDSTDEAGYDTPRGAGAEPDTSAGD